MRESWRALLAAAVPSPIHVSAELSAIGLAGRPYRDYVAALGLGRGKAKRMDAGGLISFDDRGRVQERVSQSGACSDSLSLQDGVVALNPSGKSFSAAYFPESTLRTRCPGPFVNLEPATLTGLLGRRELSKRVFSSTMNTGTAFQHDGDTGRLVGHLSMTLRRERISSSTFSFAE